VALAAGVSPPAETIVRQLDSPRGIAVVLQDREAKFAIELAQASELTVFAQLTEARHVEAARRVADARGLLNRRVYVEEEKGTRIALADNLADAVVVCGPAPPQALEREVLRVLRPGGKAWRGGKVLVKPQAEGVDEWSYPYHGPDNNPQSADRVARAPYLTQFLAEPYYCPMPEMTVVAGGRMFKAFGDRAFLRPQWPVVNTLIAMNAYNGTLLWKRSLNPEFMMHRNTMIATPQTLYLADNVSCKLLDAATGQVRDEIRVPEGLSDGPVWKWMALEDGVLYALVGENEPAGDTLKGTGFRGAGWPWWKIPAYAWGFGRTIVAMDPTSKKVLWHHRETEPLDTRAMCMRRGRIYFYSHRNYLGCLDAKTGSVVWKSNDSEVLEAIGEHHPCQFPATGFATSAYVKCSDDALYFAGPQRTKLVAVSTKDGKLLWQYPDAGAFQLVLRDDGLYAMGASHPSRKFEPLTGKVLAQLPNRAGCTRATGSADRLFVRGGGDGTVSWDIADGKMLQISPMRPACHDGVVVADGSLYWGPWMCGCNLSLIGIVSLRPAGDFDFSQEASEKDRLEVVARRPASVARFALTTEDWATYRKDNARSTCSPQAAAADAVLRWTYTPDTPTTCTAPVAAGDLVFVAGADGIVRAMRASDGKLKWTVSTGGAIRVPPSISDGRALVGSADGWVYALEATSGRLLWRFRAAPSPRKIPVYGSLQSTWPVASGVVAENGLAYAAAGIANYDGTHVYALDAATGKIRWQNNTSGVIEGGQGSGVSVQGDLLLANDRLYLAGGNRVRVASYDLADGQFEPARVTPGAVDRKGPRGHDLFLRGDGSLMVSNRLPWYSRVEDSHYIDCAELMTAAGRLVVGNADLRLLPRQGEAAGTAPIWVSRPFQEPAALAIAKNAVIVAGTNRELDANQNITAETFALTALDLRDGKPLWRYPLPAGPVGWGVAINREGQILVSLRDGRILCFGKS
jgi:outer membrane protein assembly factor BamB